MAWTDSVSAYCERLGPGFFAEPLNALSNVAFVVAAIALTRLHADLRRDGQRIPGDVRALPWLVWGVAICSLLFHTFATRWSGSLDSLSILLFCAVGVYSVKNNVYDIGFMTLFGVIGYVLIRLEADPAPLLLGLVLGPMMEQKLRRAMVIADGDWTVFVRKPISAALLAAALALVVAIIVPNVRRARDAARAVE